MKKIYLLTVGLMLSNSIQSQNYIPLLIDSLYTWSWTTGFHGDTIVGTSWAGFTYDSNDSLIQTRNPNSRFNFSYSVDTVHLLSESMDADSNWVSFSRSKTAYKNGETISKLTENLVSNAWEPAALHTYFHDASQLDTLYLLQHWKGGRWVNFYKKRKIFDATGNNTEEAEYYVNANGDFDYNRGKRFYYDNAGHLVEEIRISSSINGEYFTGKTNWAYGNDNLLDTIKRCHYGYPNNGVFNNVAMATYAYLGQDTVIENDFTWKDGGWKKDGKKLTFTGQEIYSGKPDSVIFYDYRADSLTYVPTMRQYLHYEDLGGGRIFFKEEKYSYFGTGNKWLLTYLAEEWYHIKTAVGVQQATHLQESVSVFPNPCLAGQNLGLKKNLGDEKNVELFIFDLKGHLVSKNTLSDKASFQAPKQEGIYTIVIRKNGRVVGVSKQIVME